MSTSQSCVIFTSGPSLNRAAISDLFKSYKNYNQVPCPVGNTNVFPVQNTYTAEYGQFVSTIGHAAASLVRNEALDLEKPTSIHGYDVGLTIIDKLISTPKSSAYDIP